MRIIETKALFKSAVALMALKGPLVKSTLRSSSCGGRTLTRDRADEVDEELRQFLVVDRVEDTKRKDLHARKNIRRIISASTDDCSYREYACLIGRNLTVKTSAELGKMLVQWVCNIRPNLQVPWVLCHLTVPNACGR